MPKHHIWRAVIAAAIMVVTACGTTSSTPSTSGTAHFPVTITGTNGAGVTITRQPHRIVSLSATATEMLFAISAGAQVVAVDDQSNYPASAPMTKLSGFQPNIEAIASYAPDLVVAVDDTSGLVHGLGALSIPVLIETAAKNFDGSYRQIEQLGVATGHVADASSLEKTMRADLAAIVASIPNGTRQLKVYHELDDTYYSATSATFIGQVYALLKLTNIADGAKASAGDYPQLSAEYIVSSSPDVIVLADTRCCHQNLSTVAARPGWASIAAVKSGQVIGVDDDIASRWGPRVVEFMRALAPHVKQLEAQAA